MSALSRAREGLSPRLAAAIVVAALLQVALASQLASESPLPIMLAVLAAFVVAAAIEPRVAFCVPFFYLLLSQTEKGAITLSDLIIALGPIVVASSALAGGEIARRARRMVAAHRYKLFVAVFAVLVVLAGAKAITSGAGAGSYQPMRLALVPAVLLSLAVFRDRADLLRGLRICFYAFSVYAFALALVLLATGGTATTSSVSTGGERVVANSSAMFAVMAFVLVALHLAGEDRLGRRIGLSALMLMNVITILLSLARTSWAAAAILIPLMAILVPSFRRGLLRFAAAAAPFVILVALLAPIVAEDQLQYIRDRVERPQGPVQRDQSAVTREKSWSLMMERWREAPVLGNGFGQKVSFEANDESIKEVVNDPHNGFIFILVSMGVVGLATFALIQAGFLAMCASAIRGSPIGRQLGIWCAAAWFVFMANAFLGVLLIVTAFNVFLWTVLSIPAAIAALPERAAPEPAPAPEEPAAAPRAPLPA